MREERRIGDELLAGESLCIRRMRAEDLAAVMEIERASYSMPWSDTTFRGLIRRADADVVVAESGAELIGYAAIWFVVDQGELGNIAVADGWRGRGIGARLVEAALEHARSRGAREVFLEVRPSNIVAQRLYARLGFREVGRRRHYYLDPVEDALVMRCATEVR